MSKILTNIQSTDSNRAFYKLDQLVEVEYNVRVYNSSGNIYVDFTGSIITSLGKYFDYKNNLPSGAPSYYQLNPFFWHLLLNKGYYVQKKLNVTGYISTGYPTYPILECSITNATSNSTDFRASYNNYSDDSPQIPVTFSSSSSSGSTIFTEKIINYLFM